MTRILLAVFVVLGLGLVMAPASIARAVPPTGTEVSTDITTDTTWTPAGSPYSISEYTFQVDAGATLTIQPGVTVYVDNQFLVYGTLIADGTSTQPITFTGSYGRAVQPASSNWSGLVFYNATTPSSLSNAVIESAFKALGGPGMPSVHDDTFVDNETAAFSQQGHPVTRSRFIGNAYAVVVNDGASVTNSDFSGNQVSLLDYLQNG